MPATVFDVTPEELEASANRIEEKVNEFNKAYTSIYAAVSDLRVTYKGEASDTFNQRIEGYRNDFDAAQKALTNYVQFIREYAANILRTENEVKGMANSLSIGQ